MNDYNSSELHRMASSIAKLVTTVTEIIEAKVQAASRAAEQAQPPAPAQVATYDPIMTKRQLAAHVHVSVRTIDSWLQRGYLPHYKIGKIVRFRLSSEAEAEPAEFFWGRAQCGGLFFRLGGPVLCTTIRLGSLSAVSCTD